MAAKRAQLSCNIATLWVLGWGCASRCVWGVPGAGVLIAHSQLWLLVALRVGVLACWQRGVLFFGQRGLLVTAVLAHRVARPLCLLSVCVAFAGEGVKSLEVGFWNGRRAADQQLRQLPFYIGTQGQLWWPAK
jgi:hypothetical protein